MQVFNRGLSVLIAAFPDNPSDLETYVMHRFVTASSRLSGCMDSNTSCPLLVANDKKSLTIWLQKNTKFRPDYKVSHLLDDPSDWGPVIWAMFHQCLGRYLKSHHYDLMNDFFKYLGVLLPCYECSKNFQELINQKSIRNRINIAKMSTKDMIKFGEWIHTQVTKKIKLKK